MENIKSDLLGYYEQKKESDFEVSCFGDIRSISLQKIICERDELDLLENAIEEAKEKL